MRDDLGDYLKDTREDRGNMGQTQTISKNNTTIRRDGLDRIVTLHSTDVVKVSPHRIILNNGGWTTKTTQARMNQVSNEWLLSYRVSIKDGEMIVSYKGKDIPFNGDSVEFER